jgi:ribose transport system permease protein
VRELGTVLRTRPYAFALLLSLALLIANVLAEPSFGEPANWPSQLAVLAPFALIAMASTPAILSGGGGVDISVAPIAALCNVLLVGSMLSNGIDSAWIGLPALLALGAALGAVNGVLVAYLRYQPVIATLCTFFVVGGIASGLGETPETASPNWTTNLADSVGFVPGPLLLLAIPIGIWVALGRTAYLRNLYAAGGGEVAAFSAGVNVRVVRVAAYALGGLFAAVAGIALTALVQSTQPMASVQYTLIALAAVALGGTPLGGGRGGLLGACLGATSIYLMQTLLSAVGVASTYLQLVYGSLLIGGVLVGALLTRPRAPAAVAE